MITEFQNEFVVNGDFYSGEKIRDMVRKNFPIVDGKYSGLARITNHGKPFHADVKLDLDFLIPDITSETKIPNPMPRNYSFGIIEGVPYSQDGNAKTFFIPTDCGYICDEMEFAR